MAELARAEERGIIEAKIHEADRAIFGLTIEGQAAEINGDPKSKERITTQLGRVMKAKSAFQQILDKYPRENVDGQGADTSTT